jgi:hypothetical protein
MREVEMNLIIETIKEINRRFPENTGILLNVLHDPEDKTDSLVATIQHGIDIDEAIDRLDLFDKEWFAEEFCNSDMKFNVSLA